MAATPPILVILVVAAAILGAVALAVYGYLGMAPERRSEVGRILGRAFVVVIAGSILLGMLAQFGR